jgi:hypothetical protein
MEKKMYTEEEFDNALTNAMNVYEGLQLRGAIKGVIAFTACSIIISTVAAATDLIVTKIKAKRMEKLAKKINEKT